MDHLDDRSDVRTIADTFEEALRRARAEYAEMPGLRLTPAQAARLWAFDSELCSRVLQELVDARYLVRTPSESFVRA